MVQAPENFERVETAANIYVRLSVEIEGTQLSFEVPVSEVDMTKDVDVERVRETGLYPDGYAISAIDIDGSITFAGNVVRVPTGEERNLDDLLFKEDGSPRVFDITVAHDNPDGEGPAPTDTIENAILTSSEYSASSGETTESSYEFMAQRLNQAEN